METVKNIAAVIGCILSAFTLISLLTKSGRALIKQLFMKNTQELQQANAQQDANIQSIEQKVDLILEKFPAIEEVSKQQCRNMIKNIYYKYQKEKKIPLYERKSADKTYYIYHQIFHENSYVTLLYQEICKWEIDTISYQDLEEED